MHLESFKKLNSPTKGFMSPFSANNLVYLVTGAFKIGFGDINLILYGHE